MLNINEKLKKSLNDINRQIMEKLQKNLIYDKELLEKMISIRVDALRPIKPLTQQEVLDKFGIKGIVGVDGSICTQGASYPHYISLMQAIAKSTVSSYENIVMIDIHTPLIDTPSIKAADNSLTVEEKDERVRVNKLALLELKAAESALDLMKPSLIMMDGSLTRFYNCCKKEWNRFKTKALDKKVIVIGIIEEIKTCEIAKKFEGLIPPGMEAIYDRELLFGMLDKGKMIVLKGWEAGDINKCFIRTSDDPHVIGIDFLKDNADKIEEAAALVMTLTPQDGRGIPLWLDIVDAEARITEKLATALIETYIDPHIRHRLLIAKRDKRKL